MHHPLSVGVGLGTNSPVDRAFYEHLGYQLRSETRLELLTVWAYVRSDDAP